jgi:Putative zinc-finger
MSCTFTEKISSLIDGELTAVEAREVERHVLSCGECEQVRADFLNLRSQIASFETSSELVVKNRELKRILTQGERVPARGIKWSWSTPAVAFATLLIAGAIIGVILYQSSPNTDPNKFVVQTPSPEPTPEPQTPGKDDKDDKEPATPKRANPPAPAKKPLAREPKPGEQFALVTEPLVTEPAVPNLAPESSLERLRPADAETLTAIHFEKSETLLRAFRNVRLNERGAAVEVAYERKRAQQLVYQTRILRRQADANGDVHVASLLENLEPILLDIANLPHRPNSNAVRAIRERVERKNIVPLLQINSAVLARALD